MNARPFILLALATQSGAFEVDTAYLASVASDIHNYLSSNFRSLMHEHANPQQAPLRDMTYSELKNTSSCGECIRAGAKFVLEHTAEKIKQKCEDAAKSDSPDSCIATRVCKMMALHKEVTLGMMIEHARPMSLASAYCYGKGACEKPDEATMNEIASGEEPHAALLEHFDKVDWSEVEAETVELMPLDHNDDEEEEEEVMMSPACKNHKLVQKVCPKCMKKKMKGVMRVSIMKVKKMCETTKCAKMQKMCGWMGEHREVALGMLVAKVEPWKFAFGACFHPHGKHGHGHHGQYHGWGHHQHRKWWAEPPAISV